MSKNIKSKKEEETMKISKDETKAKEKDISKDKEKKVTKESKISDYTFLIRFDRIRGNSNLKSDKCKLFIAKKDNVEYIIKRVVGKHYYENEHKLPGRIDNERVLKFEDVFHDGEYHYLVSRYDKDVKDLFNYIRYMDIVDEKLTKEILLEALECTKPIHDANIIHLDIKMENFLLMSKEPIRMKMIDFGYAIDISESKLDCILGTDIYIAPEIEEYTCSKASDIFSLGILAISLMIQSNTTESSNLIKKFKKRIKKSDFKSFILKMVSTNPSERPNIDECIEKLKEFNK